MKFSHFITYITQRPLLLMVASLMLAACGNNDGSTSLNSSAYSGEPATVSNEVSSPAEMSVGDLFVQFIPANESTLVDFEGVDDSATFMLGVANIASSGESSNIRLTYDESLPVVEKAALSAADGQWEEASAGEAFHLFLRNIEEQVASHAQFNGSLAKAAIGQERADSTQVGDVEKFRVLSSASSAGSYSEVSAQVVCAGENVIFHEDVDNSGELTSNDIETLCTNFDRQVAEQRLLFGSESDLNGDGKVAVLFTPAVNRLGAMAGGIITGFFYAADLQPQSAANPASNYREILYIVQPDTHAKYGYGLPKTFALQQLIPAVLVHEFQHAINFNQHVFVNRGAPEKSWLNEGLSHLAEDLFGVGQENASRYNIYLQKPQSYSLIREGSPGLAERGGIYLFLRYLYEQSANPDEFVNRLVSNGFVGVENVEEAFAGLDAEFDQFGEFYLRFASALVLSNLALSSDARYVFKTPQLHEETGRYEGAFLAGDAHDGRGTVIGAIGAAAYYGVHSAQMAPGAVKYYAISSAPRQIRIQGGNLSDTAVVLIRTK